MQRILVVANLTLGGEQLLATLRDRAQQGPLSVHVVVPARPEPNTWFESEEEQVAHARRRLQAALERFGALDGVEVSGEVGDERPIEAIGDALRRLGVEFDEIIVSTLPPGPSRWLGMDLPRRVQRSWDVPVTHVVGEYLPV